MIPHMTFYFQLMLNGVLTSNVSAGVAGWQLMASILDFLGIVAFNRMNRSGVSIAKPV
jgi:hypothetical protein